MRALFLEKLGFGSVDHLVFRALRLVCHDRRSSKSLDVLLSFLLCFGICESARGEESTCIFIPLCLLVSFCFNLHSGS